MIKWVFIGLFIFSASIGGALFFLKRGAGGPATEIDWRLLSEMDYIEHKATANLQKNDGKRVKIPGFMVPLEDNQRLVTDFLLVPNPQACIHVPPPPPNQMVYVKIPKGVPAAFGPIWVYGEFKIVVKHSQYGEASYELIGDYVEPYK